MPKSTPIASNISSTFVAKAHVSGDGPDIVIDDQADETQSASGTSPSGSAYSDYVQLFKNAGPSGDGTDSFTAQKVAFSSGTPYFEYATSAVAGNFGGDGRADDLVVASNGGGVNFPRGEVYGHVSLVMSGTGGTFGAPIDLADGTEHDSYHVAIGDFNGDGNEDIAIAGTQSSTVKIFLGNGNGTFTTNTFTASFDPTFIASADLDGKTFTNSTTHVTNPIDDIVIGSGSSLAIILGNSAGTFTGVNVTLGSNSFNSVVAADINGDGIPDLVLSGGTQVGTVLGSSSDSFSSLTQHFFAPNSATTIAVADVNGDGKPDLFPAENSNNSRQKVVNAYWTARIIRYQERVSERTTTYPGVGWRDTPRRLAA